MLGHTYWISHNAQDKNVDKEYLNEFTRLCNHIPTIDNANQIILFAKNVQGLL